MKKITITLILAIVFVPFINAQIYYSNARVISSYYKPTKVSQNAMLEKQKWFGVGFGLTFCKSQAMSNNPRLGYSAQLNRTFFRKPNAAVRINFGFNVFSNYDTKTYGDPTEMKCKQSYILYNLIVERMFLIGKGKLRPYASIGGGLGLGVNNCKTIYYSDQTQYNNSMPAKHSLLHGYLLSSVGMIHKVSDGIMLNLSTKLITGIEVTKNGEPVSNLCTTMGLMFKLGNY